MNLLLILLFTVYRFLNKQQRNKYITEKKWSIKKNSATSVLSDTDLSNQMNSTVSSVLQELNSELSKPPPGLDMYDHFGMTLAHSKRELNVTPSVYLKLQIKLLQEVQKYSET